VKGVQADAASTDTLIPRALPLAGPGQSPGLTSLPGCPGAGNGHEVYRDLELMLVDRDAEVDHTTIFRWIQAYAAELEKRIRPHLRMSNGSWRVDETSYEGHHVKHDFIQGCFSSTISLHVAVRACRGGAPCGEARPRQPRIRRGDTRATIPYSGRRSSEASGATLLSRCRQTAHVSSRPPLPQSHQARIARRFQPDFVRLPDAAGSRVS
jgi:hypothetical protein